MVFSFESGMMLFYVGEEMDESWAVKLEAGGWPGQQRATRLE